MKSNGMIAEKHEHTLPHFATLDQLTEYFETHDLGESLDKMPEVHFDVDLQKRKHIFALDDDIVEKLTKIALNEKMPSELLINSWLREKIVGSGIP